jgi:hypothetical protein
MPGWIRNNQFGAPLDGAADVIWQIEISSSEIGPMRGCVGIVINTRRIRILIRRTGFPKIQQRKIQSAIVPDASGVSEPYLFAF